MKPLTLEFCGVNSFSEPAKIDFSSLLEYGIFGIFGDTGSGKSTILDCIGFALYGDVARARSGSIADIIHYKQDKAYVGFEFETVYEGRRRVYRAERELKRKNAVQSLRVYEREGDRLVALADGVREGNALLKKIVGLEQRDFEKCIALPQGEFAQFVKSQRSDRLKLVSRLFDLERYGEGLVKRTNARFAAARSQSEILRTKLEPYAQVTRAAIAESRERLSRLEGERTEKEKKLVLLRACEKELSERYSKGKEREKLEEKHRALSAEREAYALLEKELGRLEKAGAALAANAEKKRAESARREAEESLSAAERARAKAEAAREEAARYDAEKAEEEIDALVQEHARAEAHAQTAKRRALLTEKLKKAREEYSAESKLFSDFDYEETRAELEKKIEEGGQGDFLSFAEEHGKAMLLRGEYETFAKELGALTQKHGEIAEDSKPLIEKYTALSQGEKTDFSRLRADFEARERARKEAQNALLMLEKRRGEYNAHREKLRRLHEDGVNLRNELEELGTEEEPFPPLAELEKAIAKKRAEKRENAEKLERARAAVSAANTACAAAEERKKSALREAENAQKRLSEALEGFSGVEEAAALAAKYGDPAGAEEKLSHYREECALVSARIAELSAFCPVKEEELSAAREATALCEEEGAGLREEIALVRDGLARAERDYEAKRALEEEYGKAKREEEVLERLKKLLEGNKFMEYVAEEYLQTVALNASERLLSLTDGRYFLRYEGGFFVGDNFNGGAFRAVSTLSGGETFLVSLSLALSLSAEICARSLRPAEFFFLDEGFGTLDEKLVDTVMDSLEKLRSEKLAIGIISHVEELKHRIDRKITVIKATEKHGSQIRTE